MLLGPGIAAACLLDLPLASHTPMPVAPELTPIPLDSLGSAPVALTQAHCANRARNGRRPPSRRRRQGAPICSRGVRWPLRTVRMTFPLSF